MKKLLTILLILVLALALASAALAEDADMATGEPAPVPIGAEPETESAAEPAPEASGEPTDEPTGEPSTPVLLPSIRVTETEAGEEYFKDLNADGYYKCTQRFIITNNTQISISSVHIPTYGDLESRGFDWPHDDFAFYIVNGDGVPVETEVTLGIGLYLFNILFEPGDTYAALYWNPKERPWEPTGSWEPVNSEMNDELWDIYHRAMEGREDETWYEPYFLYMTQVVDDGVNYEFYANATGEYPYWPEAWTPETFGPEVPFFMIYIHEDADGVCKVLAIQEPMYEPGGEDVPVIPTGDSFRCEDGCIVGSYTPEEEEAFVEIKVNDQGAAAGIGGAKIKVPASEPGDYVVDVYVNGGLAYQQTIPVSEASVPDILSLTFSEDGSYAKLNAAAHGLYARVALVLETSGETGLYITQAAIGGDGVILIPELDVPGLTVTGVNVALVHSPEEITSPTAEPVLFAFR